ncbi:MAG: hypothetical protein ABEI98_02155, partial [Halorhabdus sp.]
AGPPGAHTLRIWRNYRGVPFLLTETQPESAMYSDGKGPVADGSGGDWTVEVTEPETRPPTTWIDPVPEVDPIPEHYPQLDEDTDAELDITPHCGQPGTTATITGRNFPANEHVNLVWHRHQGHFAQGIPITPEPKPDVLPVVTTDADGSFRTDVTITEDKGSTRPITAEVDGRSVAVTGFVMQPDIVKMDPEQGPVGTEIEIEIAGVGWQLYNMTPSITYDNKMVGYVCGEDDARDHGITRTVLPAAGEPGLHFIDVYPSIFEVEQDQPNFEIKPHLSYHDNHPGRSGPALHFTFEVTE